MSGGRWDYKGSVVREALCDIGSDERVRERFPRLANVLLLLGPTLGKMEHDLDWDLSGDAAIEDDAAFERDTLKAIFKTIMTWTK